MVRGSVDVPVDTETPHCHNSGLGALYGVAQAEIRGRSSHSPPMQVLSDALWNGTQHKSASWLLGAYLSSMQPWQPNCLTLWHSSMAIQGKHAALCWAPELSSLLVSHQVYSTSNFPYWIWVWGNQTPSKVLFKASVLLVPISGWAA